MKSEGDKNVKPNKAKNVRRALPSNGSAPLCENCASAKSFEAPTQSTKHQHHGAAKRAVVLSV